MAAAIESAICDVLVKKSVRACRQEGVSRLVIAGGVAANRRLRSLLEQLASEEEVQVFMPHPKYCTDNAAMIAFAASARVAGDFLISDHWDVQPRWLLDQSLFPTEESRSV